MGTYIDDDDLEFLLKRHNEQYFESRFEFLNEHKGIRNSVLHVLIGSTGSGKSTLSRNIMLDCAYNKKVVVWASEESIRDYNLALNKVCRDKRLLDNITIISELDAPERVNNDIQSFMFYFREEIMKHSPDIVFIDNVTTSFMYSDAIGPRGQSSAINNLRSFAAEEFLPIFCIAHTKKTIADNSLLTINDIRGSTALSNTAAYAYVMQVFKMNKLRFSLISIQKSRYHQPENHYFKLFYDKDDGSYTKSVAVGMDIINQMYQLRDRLTDKPKSTN